MGRSLVRFVGFSNGCDQNCDRVSKNDESCHICLRWLKSCFSELWKIWDSVYLSYEEHLLKFEVREPIALERSLFSVYRVTVNTVYLNSLKYLEFFLFFVFQSSHLHSFRHTGLHPSPRRPVLSWETGDDGVYCRIHQQPRSWSVCSVSTR